MTDAQLGGPAVGRRFPVRLLLVVGVLATVGGAVGAVLAKMSDDEAMLAGSGSGSGFARLQVGADSNYLFPGSHSITPNYTSVWIAATIAGIGAIALLLGIILAVRARSGGQPLRAPLRRIVALPIGLGSLATVLGVVGGLWAKSSADIASYLASQPTAQTLSDSSSGIALTFAPSPGDYVAPDYTMFWIGMAVAAIGIIAVLAGIVAARTKPTA